MDKVIFLDRDGVINKRMAPHCYVTQWESFQFLPGVIEGLQIFMDKGYSLFIITNQRGISRGLMTESDLLDIHTKMQEELTRHGVRILQIYHCPHGSDDGCDCRKPKPGMFIQAARDHGIDLTKAYFIGDDENDRQAGESAGCRTIILQEGEVLLNIAKSLQ